MTQNVSNTVTQYHCNKTPHMFMFEMMYGSLSATAAIALGHVFLPAIGLKSALVGGGPLSTAAIAYLAGSGISLIPAVLLFLLIDKTVTNINMKGWLKFLISIGFTVSSYLVGAALFDVSSTSLFLQFLGGSLAVVGPLVGLVVVGALLAGAVTIAMSCSTKMQEIAFTYKNGYNDNEDADAVPEPKRL